jgi:hypothetical protein
MRRAGTLALGFPFAATSLTLDEQAQVLGLSRGTTWTLLKGIHKGSGLSARTITRMLSAPQLAPVVRAKLLEYLAEKMLGLYGDTQRELRRFVLWFSPSVLNEAFGAEGCKRLAELIGAQGTDHDDENDVLSINDDQELED